MEQSKPQTSSESNWPGERDPSRDDVQVANELPEPAFLSDFKRSLLSSSDASENLSLMHLDFQVRQAVPGVNFVLTTPIVGRAEKVHLPSSDIIRLSRAPSVSERDFSSERGLLQMLTRPRFSRSFALTPAIPGGCGSTFDSCDRLPGLGACSP